MAALRVVAALGAGVCLCAALRDGCWLVAARACCCATFRSLPSVGAAFLARSARSMSAALISCAVDLFAQRPRARAPRFVRVRGVVRALRDLPERAASPRS